jgi:hypothetical protein
MKCGQLVRLKLGGLSTRFWLRGSLRTAVSLKTALRLARELACWSGWPGSCVLSVDRELVCWCEWWTDLLADISARHLELRYRIRQPELWRGDR